MKLANLRLINTARKQRKKVVTVTDIVSGEQLVLVDQAAFKYSASAVDGTGMELESDNAQNGEQGFRFTNVYFPSPRIVVIGAVHITQALARLAGIAAFDILVIDPRAAFATPERFPDVELVPEWPEDVLRTRGLDQFTALVALSHDPKIDDYAIASALQQECFYVGALGSRKSHSKRLERLEAQGLPEAYLQRIHGPIGVDIGAKSPAEIAVAILADIIKAWRRPNGTTP